MPSINAIGAAGLGARLLSVESGRVTANAATGVAATDGAHLQALIDTGPGIVHLRDDSLYVGNVVLKPGVLLYIPPGTTLRGAAGVTAPVVDGLNFATLTGKTKATGDYLLGAPGAGVVGGGIVDGNNVATRCVRIWGMDLRLEFEAIRSNSHGIETEFTEVDSFADEAQRLEAKGGQISSHGHAGDGWLMKGPHDTVVVSFITWDNGGWGITVDGVVALNSYLGGVTLNHFNSYLNTSGSVRVLGAGYISIDSGALSGGAVGTGLDLASTTGSCTIKGFISGHVDGAIMRGTGHQIDCKFTDNTSDAIVLDGCGSCSIRGVGAGNNNVINVISETGPNHIEGRFNVGAGKTLKAGAGWNSRTYVQLQGNGAGGDFVEQKLTSGVIEAAGWKPVLPLSNGTLLTGDLATFTAQAAAGVPNNSLFRDSADGKLKYKDNGGVSNALY